MKRPFMKNAFKLLPNSTKTRRVEFIMKPSQSLMQVMNQINEQHIRASVTRKKNYWSFFDSLLKVLGLPITTSLLYYAYDRRQTFVKFLEEHSDVAYKDNLRALLVFYHRNNRDSKACVKKYFGWHFGRFSKVYSGIDIDQLHDDPEFKEYMHINGSLTHIWDFSSRMHQIRNSSALNIIYNLNEEQMLGTTHLIVMSQVICPIEMHKPRDRAGYTFTSEMCAQFQRRFRSMESDWTCFVEREWAKHVGLNEETQKRDISKVCTTCGEYVEEQPPANEEMEQALIIVDIDDG